MSRKLFAVALLSAMLLVACGSDKEKETEPGAASSEKATTSEAAGEAAAPETTGESAAQADNTIVAVVNGVEISQKLFDSQLSMTEASRLMFGSMEESGEENATDLALQLEVLASLISLELAGQEAAKLGYAPSVEDIDAAMAEIKSGFESPERFAEFLDLYGQTEADLRHQLAQGMALEAWQEKEVLPQITITEDEAKAFYEQNPALFEHEEQIRVSQLLVPVMPTNLETGEEASPEDIAAAREKVSAFVARLQNGESFENLVAEISQDPAVAPSQGDLGFLEREGVPPRFAEALAGLAVGEVSSLIESPMGFHLFKVTEVKPAGQSPFAEMQSDITSYLAEEKQSIMMNKKMLELYDNSKVEIKDPGLAEAFADLRAEEEKLASTGNEPIEEIVEETVAEPTADELAIENLASEAPAAATESELSQ